MTKSYFIQLADFNIWANDIACSWLGQITEEQWKQPIVSSFDSISATVLHVISAEMIWLDRMTRTETPPWKPSDFRGTKKDGLELWKKASSDLRSFLEDFDEEKLETDLVFRRLNGELYEIPHYQVFAHVFNHSTYHRGQLVTMLRQVGFTGVGSTDMLAYFNTIKSKHGNS